MRLPWLKGHHFPCMHLESEDEYRAFLQDHQFDVEDIVAKNFTYDLSPEETIQVFNSGPIKAYTSQRYYDEGIENRAINEFYNLFQKEVHNTKLDRITYPRVLIKCQIRNR